jgi:CHASE3 domain sensor protein
MISCSREILETVEQVKREILETIEQVKRAASGEPENLGHVVSQHFSTITHHSPYVCGILSYSQ